MGHRLWAIEFPRKNVGVQALRFGDPCYSQAEKEIQERRRKISSDSFEKGSVGTKDKKELEPRSATTSQITQ